MIHLLEIEDFTPYITTVINNGTDNLISFEDKEEIYSDTFFLLWKNRDRLNINVSLNSYLAGITRNLIKEKYRKLKLTYDISYFENDTSNSVNMYESDREFIYDVEQKIRKLKNIDIEIVNLFYYSSDGQTGDFFDIWNNNSNIQNTKKYMTKEQAKELADKYYYLFGYKEGEYEITKIL